MSSLWGVHIILIGPKSLLSSSFLPFLLIEEKESKIGDGPAKFINISILFSSKHIDPDDMMLSANSTTEEEDSDDFVQQLNDTMEEDNDDDGFFGLS